MNLSPTDRIDRPQRLAVFLDNLSRFPWKNTAHTLHARFREDRLGLTAGSLTFTTIIALVPLFTVLLAVFTAFPMFAKFQGVLQQWLIESLIPDTIARQVLGYLTQFAGKARKLGGAGLAVLFITALALILTIDRTLNAIWRVRKPRPLGQRVLVYWAVMTLGPIFLALSVSLTSYALSGSKGLVGGLPGGVQLLLDSLQLVLLAWAWPPFTAMFPIPGCAGHTPGSAACLCRWDSRWQRTCLWCTWPWCPRIRCCMVPSPRCRSC